MLGRRFGPAILSVLALAPWTNAGELFVSQPGQILKLVDLNSDGDYLDFAEKTVFANGLPAGLGAITRGDGALYVVQGATSTIYVIRDLNGDGDALDFAEVLPYAQLVVQPTPSLVGLATDADGSLLTINSITGVLYRATDLNGDGDAFEAGELTQVAANLTGPVSIAARPDGRLLIATTGSAVPVRILRDLTADGDFLDFAENISYAENSTPGSDLVAATDRLAYLARPSDGRIMALRDLTGDGDVLDFGEIIAFAEGLPSPTKLALDGTGGLWVACQDVSGTIYHVRDLNGDGDALDFAEAIVVATGAMQVGGMVFVAPPQAGCIKGDADGNATVNTLDIAPMVDILLGNVVPADPCPADVNNDGEIDARDLAPFIALLF